MIDNILGWAPRCSLDCWQVNSTEHSALCTSLSMMRLNWTTRAHQSSIIITHATLNRSQLITTPQLSILCLSHCYRVSLEETTVVLGWCLREATIITITALARF